MIDSDLKPGFVRDPLTATDDRTKIYHRDGIPWHDAPPPPRRHDHFVQTYAWMDWIKLVQRCPCSAMRMPPSGWVTEEQIGGAKSRIADDPPNFLTRLWRGITHTP